jgi:hypothetical protein
VLGAYSDVSTLNRTALAKTKGSTTFIRGSSKVSCGLIGLRPGPLPPSFYPPPPIRNTSVADLLKSPATSLLGSLSPRGLSLVLTMNSDPLPSVPAVKSTRVKKVSVITFFPYPQTHSFAEFSLNRLQFIGSFNAMQRLKSISAFPNCFVRYIYPGFIFLIIIFLIQFIANIIFLMPCNLQVFPKRVF